VKVLSKGYTLPAHLNATPHTSFCRDGSKSGYGGSRGTA
jgi:hypothetical protein